jgi:hypothetical protein
MKALIAVLVFAASLSQASAAGCDPVRAYTCSGMIRGTNISYYVSFEEMMKVLGGKTGLTYDETQGFGEHTNCKIPTGAGSAKIKFRKSDDFLTGKVLASVKTSQGWAKVICEELEGGF